MDIRPTAAILPNDETRCRGEGHWGHLCPRRETCARYAQLLLDREAYQQGQGPRRWCNHADYLCSKRELQHPYWIPL